MTWNGSRQSAAFGALAATVAWIHSAPSALTWVNKRGPLRPEGGEELREGSELRPSWAHTITPGVVIDHHRQVAVPLAVGDFVDPDAPQPF